MEHKHTASIQKPKDKAKIIGGKFSVKDGKLDFTCTNQNVSFKEVKNALILLRDEIQRQLDNEKKCPFYEQ